MEGRLFINSANVHQGGGKTLLDALMLAFSDGAQLVLMLDSRMPIPDGLKAGAKIKFVKAGIFQRLMAEMWLAKSVKSDDTILCFGNLPPLFKLRGYTIVFIQNRYLIDKIWLSGFNLKTRLKMNIERLWLLLKSSNADEFIVQTATMKTALKRKLKGKSLVDVAPFVMDVEGYSRSLVTSDRLKNVMYDFVYVASGEPHKNHRRLIEAWCLLASDGIFPTLCLTLDENAAADLCVWIQAQKKQFGLKIDNLGWLPHDEVLKLYPKAGALLYPSKLESFGLPMIEARRAGLPILAPELDYVRDVIDPDQTFNPDSPISISRAVRRFLGVNEESVAVDDANTFIQRILNRLN